MNDNGLIFHKSETEIANFACVVTITNINSEFIEPTTKYLLFTNKGIYIFFDLENPCKVCPRKGLCPEGPKLFFKKEYSEIETILKFQNEQ